MSVEYMILEEVATLDLAAGEEVAEVGERNTL
jgi:hypothetical protein